MAVKRPAEKSTGPSGKFRKGNDNEKTAVKKPSIEKDARAPKASNKGATVGQKPFVKKIGDGKKPFKKASRPGEKKPIDEKPKWFEMKKKDRKKVSFSSPLPKVSLSKLWDGLSLNSPISPRR